MIRFAWIRFRPQALAGAGVLAIAGAVLLVTGIQLNHAYYAAVAVCRQRGNCAHMFTYTFPSQGYLDAGNDLSALTLAVPGLIGMFWGAPLAAREFETGTFRLVWTQGITRTRWLAAKLAITGAAAIAACELFTLMVNWWSSPIHKAEPGYTPFAAGSFHTGVAPAGYAAFAFALGVTAGLLIRHTLPATAVTLAVFTAVIIAFPIWVRPHLIPPVQTTSTLSLASIATMPGVGAFNGYLSLDPGSAAAPPGAWVISSSQLAAPDGRAASSEPAGPCGSPPPAAAQACNEYIESLHLRQTVTYQPASRYWAFQWAETATYLALALALAGLSFWWINRNRSMELNIRVVVADQHPVRDAERRPRRDRCSPRGVSYMVLSAAGQLARHKAAQIVPGRTKEARCRHEVQERPRRYPRLDRARRLAVHRRWRARPRRAASADPLAARVRVARHLARRLDRRAVRADDERTGARDHGGS